MFKRVLSVLLCFSFILFLGISSVSIYAETVEYVWSEYDMDWNKHMGTYYTEDNVNFIRGFDCLEMLYDVTYYPFNTKMLKRVYYPKGSTIKKYSSNNQIAIVTTATVYIYTYDMVNNKWEYATKSNSNGEIPLNFDIKDIAYILYKDEFNLSESSSDYFANTKIIQRRFYELEEYEFGNNGTTQYIENPIIKSTGTEDQVEPIVPDEPEPEKDEQLETSKGIWGTIKDIGQSIINLPSLIAGFIIDGFKSLFIPDDGYFNQVFAELNEFFADRFGVLYLPIDYLIKFLESVVNSPSAQSTFHLSGLRFPKGVFGDKEVILIKEQDIKIIPEGFEIVQTGIHTLTGVIIIYQVIKLAERKYKEVMP